MNRNRICQLRKRSRLVKEAATLVWLDRETTAAYLGIGRTKLDTLASLGILKPSKLGRRTIYNRQYIDQYMIHLAGLTPGPERKL